MKILCFDLDGTLCNNTWGDYKNSIPNKKAIKKVNNLYISGFYIKIFTARFMSKYNENIKKVHEEGYNFTKEQIISWGLQYNELILGKPSYDYIIDDKSYNFNSNWIDLDFQKIFENDDSKLKK